MKLRWPLVVVLLVVLSSPLPGQWGRSPRPNGAGYGGAFVGGGFSYSRGKVQIGAGFVSASPYGPGRLGPLAWRSYSSLTVVSLYTPPPVIVVQPPPIVLGLGPRPRDPEPPPVPDVPPVPEVKKPPAPPAAKAAPAPKREVDLERFLDRADDPPAVGHPRLVKEGREAFAEGSYGLAAQRFRAATRLLPDEALPYFLLGESLIALGKYHEASEALVTGLAKDGDWPSAKFRPKDLYGGNDRDHDEHRERLGEALRRHPRDPVLLFLRGYQLWFAGERKEATALFRQALPRSRDPKAIERFLAAAGAKP